MSKILVADDERSICDAFSDFLIREGHTPIIARDGKEALHLVETEKPAVCFLDIQMPGMNGLETLEAVQKIAPTLPVILMTAYGTVDTAIAAVRLGVFDYLGKPVDLARVRGLLNLCLEQSKPSQQSDKATQVDIATTGEAQIIGQSAVMQEVFKLIGLVANNMLPVLLTGESGVGKELVARSIHAHGANSSEPFVAVNCAAIPDTLLESELFGHEKGSFTGAERKNIGRFEAAGTGTLFLDEVSELPLHLQSKLLRVLQERSFERIGSSSPIPVNARVIAASNRDLEPEAQSGRFRDDLYHRLSTVTIHIPALRERKEDISTLTHYFLARANSELDKNLESIDDKVLELLEDYDWPGNVRELQNTIRRSVLHVRGKKLTAHDLRLSRLAPGENHNQPDLAEEFRTIVRAILQRDLEDPSRQSGDDSLFHKLVSDAEHEIISEALRITDGNQVAASALLGLNRTSLRNKIRR